MTPAQYNELQRQADVIERNKKWKNKINVMNKVEEYNEMRMKSIDAMIDVLNVIVVTGEEIEYIIEKNGMMDQMLRQLVLKANVESVNELIEEKSELTQWSDYMATVDQDNQRYSDSQ